MNCRWASSSARIGSCVILGVVGVLIGVTDRASASRFGNFVVVVPIVSSVLCVSCRFRARVRSVFALLVEVTVAWRK